MKYVEVYTDSAEKALKVAQATVDGLNGKCGHTGDGKELVM